MNKKWGLLPQAVRALVLKREWQNSSNLKQRLLGVKPFPIRIGLKPPGGGAVIEDIGHFQQYIASWRAFEPQALVIWDNKNYRQLGAQQVATFLQINSVQALIDFVGGVKRSEQWQLAMSPLLQLSEQFYPVLVKHLETLEQMSGEDATLIAQLLPQLQRHMGHRQYLRSLPLIGVDTKFLEHYQSLVSDLLDCQHDNAITECGGLLAWLDCQQNPKGWLTVRPLCAKVAARMANLAVLQLPVDSLRAQPLPAKHILVVENMQSGLGLPLLDDTIAVFGGGKNVSWMDADWLKEKQVGYWGDIDSWGLAILSDARRLLPTLTPLMMDNTTVKLHQQRMVTETKPLDSLPDQLTRAEAKLFYQLTSGHFAGSRLEQERLSPDYILMQLNQWRDQ
ncbi:MAG: hypothetical protein ACI8WB_001034 [Phenylobacterium sp.]|jgi:hypothetical protein